MSIRLAITGLAAVLSCAQIAPATAADQALVDAAKKEGRLTWYTLMNIESGVRPVADAFANKYGIKVDFVGGDSAGLALRIRNESLSGRMFDDVFDGTSVAAALKKQALVLQWLPDGVKRLPKQYYDAEGYWIAPCIYVYTPVFNTELVPKGTEPRTLDDLLDPKWRGKMAWSVVPGLPAADGFVSLVLAAMGKDKGMAYLQQFAKQQVAGLGVNSLGVLKQVIAGEYAIGLQVFNNQTAFSAAHGAPVDWIPMQPATASLGTVSITKDSPHPNAAKLFLDFLLSPDGQKIFRNDNYIPVDPAFPPNDPTLRPDGENFKAIYFTPEEIDRDMPAWTDVYNEVLR